MWYMDMSLQPKIGSAGYKTLPLCLCTWRGAYLQKPRPYGLGTCAFRNIARSEYCRP